MEHNWLNARLSIPRRYQCWHRRLQRFDQVCHHLKERRTLTVENTCCFWSILKSHECVIKFLFVTLIELFKEGKKTRNKFILSLHPWSVGSLSLFIISCIWQVSRSFSLFEESWATFSSGQHTVITPFSKC